jgi:cation transport regulator ChaC
MNELPIADLPASTTWIFGYGSLIWRPGFAYTASSVASIQHHSRRFWQGSTDHRGVPGAPGRVVTLIEKPGATCWGRAFALPPNQRRTILASLDHREIGGYQRLSLPVQLQSGRVVTGVTWIATADNDNYLGPATVSQIARQVAVAKGPSGTNREYVLRLKEALTDAGHPDAHVAEIATALNQTNFESS